MQNTIKNKIISNKFTKITRNTVTITCGEMYFFIK